VGWATGVVVTGAEAVGTVIGADATVAVDVADGDADGVELAGAELADFVSSTTSARVICMLI
jgi:hypothetical protein